MEPLKVGALYNPNRTSWPDGQAELRLSAQGIEFVLFFGKPTAKEIQAVRKAPARFAWVSGEAGRGALLAYSFTDGKGSGIRWSDAPYHHAKLPPEDAAAFVAGGGSMLCIVVLVDANTGIVKALRQVSWPAAALDAIRATCAEQLAAGHNERAEAAWLRQVWDKYSGAQLVQGRADITWTGGQTTTSEGTGLYAMPPEAPPTPEPGIPSAVIQQHFGNVITRARTYPEPLPDDLAPWYCYLADAGHSVAVAVESRYRPDTGPEHWLVPAPVRTVLKAGWTVDDAGFVHADLHYDPELGLVCDEADTEY